MALNGNSKPMYQPWNEDEFNADVHVRAMTPVQRWIYRTLLQQSFFHSTRPYLPKDDELLWKLAGCESKKQWLSNKSTILCMFSETEQDGVPLLYQKRVLEDWQRVLDKREVLVERGRSGGRASAQLALERKSSTSQASEVKGSEVSEGEVWSAPKSVNLKKTLPVVCLKLLRVKSEPTDWWKDEIQELSDAFGSGKVLEAFETWAATQTGSEVRKPVSSFLRVATGYLDGSFGTTGPELDDLCVKLLEIGGQAFTGKHKAALARLRVQFPDAEILAAYSAFVADKDDFDMKYAPRDFSEGGAVAFITLQRKRKEETAQVEAVMADNRKEMERLAEEERENLAAVEQQEAESMAEDFNFDR